MYVSPMTEGQIYRTRNDLRNYGTAYAFELARQKVGILRALWLVYLGAAMTRYETRSRRVGHFI